LKWEIYPYADSENLSQLRFSLPVNNIRRDRPVSGIVRINNDEYFFSAEANALTDNSNEPPFESPNLGPIDGSLTDTGLFASLVLEHPAFAGLGASDEVILSQVTYEGYDTFNPEGTTTTLTNLPVVAGNSALGIKVFDFQGGANGYIGGTFEGTLEVNIPSWNDPEQSISLPFYADSLSTSSEVPVAFGVGRVREVPVGIVYDDTDVVTVVGGVGFVDRIVVERQGSANVLVTASLDPITGVMAVQAGLAYQTNVVVGGEVGQDDLTEVRQVVSPVEINARLVSGRAAVRAEDNATPSDVTLYGGLAHETGLTIDLPAASSAILVDSPVVTRIDANGNRGSVALSATEIGVRAQVHAERQFVVPLGVTEIVDIQAPIFSSNFQIQVQDSERTQLPKRSSVTVGRSASLSGFSSGVIVGPEPDDLSRAALIYVEAIAGDILVDGRMLADEQSYVLASGVEAGERSPFRLQTDSTDGAPFGVLEGDTVVITLGNDTLGFDFQSIAESVVSIDTRVTRLRTRAGSRGGDPLQQPFPYDISVREEDGLVVDSVMASSGKIDISAEGALEFLASVATAGDVRLSSGNTFLVNAPVSTSFGKIEIVAPTVEIQSSVRVHDTIADERTTDLRVESTEGGISIGNVIGGINRVELIAAGAVSGEGLVVGDLVEIRSAESISAVTDARRIEAFISGENPESAVSLAEQNWASFQVQGATNVSLTALGNDLAIDADGDETTGLVDLETGDLLDRFETVSPALFADVSDASEIIVTAPNGSIDLLHDGSGEVRVGNENSEAMGAAGSVVIRSTLADTLRVFDAPSAASSAIEVRFATTKALPMISGLYSNANDPVYSGNKPGVRPATLEFTVEKKNTLFDNADGFTVRPSDLVFVKDGMEVDENNDDVVDNKPDHKVNGIYQVASRVFSNALDPNGNPMFDADGDRVVLVTYRLVRPSQYDETPELASRHYVRVMDSGEQNGGLSGKVFVSDGFRNTGPDELVTPPDRTTPLKVERVRAQAGYTAVRALTVAALDAQFVTAASFFLAVDDTVNSASTFVVRDNYDNTNIKPGMRIVAADDGRRVYVEKVESGPNPNLVKVTVSEKVTLLGDQDVEFQSFDIIRSTTNRRITSTEDQADFGQVALRKDDLVLVQFGTSVEADERSNGVYKVTGEGANPNQLGVGGDTWKLERYQGVDDDGDGEPDPVYTGVFTVNEGIQRTALTGDMFEVRYESLNQAEVKYRELLNYIDVVDRHEEWFGHQFKESDPSALSRGLEFRVEEVSPIAGGNRLWIELGEVSPNVIRENLMVRLDAIRPDAQIDEVVGIDARGLLEIKLDKSVQNVEVGDVMEVVLNTVQVFGNKGERTLSVAPDDVVALSGVSVGSVITIADDQYGVRGVDMLSGEIQLLTELKDYVGGPGSPKTASIGLEFDHRYHYRTDIGTGNPEGEVEFVVTATDGMSNQRGTLGRMMTLAMENVASVSRTGEDQKTSISFGDSVLDSAITLRQELPEIDRPLVVGGRVSIDGSQIRFNSNGGELRTLSPSRRLAFGPILPGLVSTARRLTRGLSLRGVDDSSVNGFVIGPKGRGTVLNGGMAIGGFTKGAAISIEATKNVLIEDVTVGKDLLGDRAVNNKGIVITSGVGGSGQGVTLLNVGVYNSVSSRAGIPGVGVEVKAGAERVRIVGSEIGAEGHGNDEGINVVMHESNNGDGDGSEQVLIGVADIEPARRISASVEKSSLPVPPPVPPPPGYVPPGVKDIVLPVTLWDAGVRAGQQVYHEQSGNLWRIVKLEKPSDDDNSMLASVVLTEEGAPDLGDSDLVSIEFGHFADFKFFEGSLRVPASVDPRDLYVGQTVLSTDSTLLPPNTTIKSIHELIDEGGRGYTEIILDFADETGRQRIQKTKKAAILFRSAGQRNVVQYNLDGIVLGGSAVRIVNTDVVNNIYDGIRIDGIDAQGFGSQQFEANVVKDGDSYKLNVQGDLAAKFMDRVVPGMLFEYGSALVTTVDGPVVGSDKFKVADVSGIQDGMMLVAAGVNRGAYVKAVNQAAREVTVSEQVSLPRDEKVEFRAIGRFEQWEALFKVSADSNNQASVQLDDSDGLARLIKAGFALEGPGVPPQTRVTQVIQQAQTVRLTLSQPVTLAADAIVLVRDAEPVRDLMNHSLKVQNAAGAGAPMGWLDPYVNGGNSIELKYRRPVIEIGGTGGDDVGSLTKLDRDNAVIHSNGLGGVVVSEDVFKQMGSSGADDSGGEPSRMLDMLGLFRLVGNYIGTDTSGRVGLANGRTSVANVVVRGDTAEARQYNENLLNDRGVEGSTQYDHDNDPATPQLYDAPFRPWDNPGNLDSSDFREIAEFENIDIESNLHGTGLGGSGGGYGDGGSVRVPPRR
jgi:hypothetical protein